MTTDRASAWRRIRDVSYTLFGLVTLAALSWLWLVGADSRGFQEALTTTRSSGESQDLTPFYGALAGLFVALLIFIGILSHYRRHGRRRAAPQGASMLGTILVVVIPLATGTLLHLYG
jgi:hypothetical protein